MTLPFAQETAKALWPILADQQKNFYYLVVDRLFRISEVEDDSKLRLRATAVGELLGEVDGAVEAERAVIVNVNVERLEVCESVDDTDVTSLQKSVGDDDVLLVRSNLDVVRTNGRLVLIRVVEALDVVQVGDIEGSDVVGGGEGEYDGLLVSRVYFRVILNLQYVNLPSEVMSELIATVSRALGPKS